MKHDFRELPVSDIHPDPYQPRKVFEEEGLNSLATSIRRFGVLQPLVVRPDDDGGGFIIIAGERRWRASQIAGLTTVPVIVRDFSGEEGGTFLQSLTENLQRMDLSPVEKALALKQVQNRMDWTHDVIARELGVARVTVTNLLRLLTCPQEVLDYLQKGLLTEGHVRALMPLDNPEKMVELASEAVKNVWPVRRLEREVRSILRPRPTPAPKPEEAPQEDAPPLYKMAAQTLEDYLGTKVEIRKGRVSNTLVIHFYDDNSLMDILGKFPIEEEL